MGRLLFKCPKSGEEFDSGFRAQTADFKDVPAGAEIRLRCRVCGESHQFRFTEARIDDKD